MRNIDPRQNGGGIYHALIGTIEMSASPPLIGIPIGILVAIYLVEYGRGGRLARAISFFVDVMTGVPSIVAGLFVYTGFVLTLGFERSGFAGSLALSILMIPVMVRSTEEMLKLVPNELRESSYALGVPKYRTILRVVLPTATQRHHHRRHAGRRPRRRRDGAAAAHRRSCRSRSTANPFTGPQASLPDVHLGPDQHRHERIGGTGLGRRADADPARLMLNLAARVIAYFSRTR